MNKQDKKKAKKKLTPSDMVRMPIVNSDAAGIDISATIHAVAVPIDRDEESVRLFGGFTEDLKAIAEWLRQCSITSVAMESTGVYWKPLYMILIENGFEVLLVNAKHVKNVTGRKTDEEDARWIQKLHSCGLLKSSFIPDNATEQLRTLVRHRKRLLEDSSKYVQRMQKALELMNIKIHSVISDLMGKTGTAIIEAILAGERMPKNFLIHVDGRIKADSEKITQSLTGNWREEQLFLLEENYSLYQYIQQRIISCESKIEKYFKSVITNSEGIHQKQISTERQTRKSRQKKKNDPLFDVRGYLYRIHGVDVTEIFGISETSALEILAETGTDLSKWEDEKKFVSWLNLCPNNKISGGKLISSMVMSKKSGYVAQSFRAAANGLQRSDHWLGDYFRRMKTKGGNKYAIIATARKLAIIYYKMVRYKQEFNPIDAETYRQKYKAVKIAWLEKQLSRLKVA